jgi:hypothetical protein
MSSPTNKGRGLSAAAMAAATTAAAGMPPIGVFGAGEGVPDPPVDLVTPTPLLVLAGLLKGDLIGLSHVALVAEFLQDHILKKAADGDGDEEEGDDEEGDDEEGDDEEGDDEEGDDEEGDDEEGDDEEGDDDEGDDEGRDDDAVFRAISAYWVPFRTGCWSVLRGQHPTLADALAEAEACVEELCAEGREEAQSRVLSLLSRETAARAKELISMPLPKIHYQHKRVRR